MQVGFSRPIKIPRLQPMHRFDARIEGRSPVRQQRSPRSVRGWLETAISPATLSNVGYRGSGAGEAKITCLPSGADRGAPYSRLDLQEETSRGALVSC